MDTISPVMSNTLSRSRSVAEPEQLHQVATAASRRSSASSAPSTGLRPSLTRRTSLEEDYFYREVMTVEKKPTEPPPSYDSTMKKTRRKEQAAAVAAERQKAELKRVRDAVAAVSSSSHKGKEKAPIEPAVVELSASGDLYGDVLPAYSCDIHIEGIFQRKMEIEKATKRAEDRRWTPAYVVLHGTALDVYEGRKDRSWASRTARTGPGVSPDRPPWMRKGPLEKSYNLTYADVGIAADYVKRRYVIRVRAETDQFLLSCIELETFVQWLDAFFAALSVAAPIDERDFPRDQSIPRIQRIRWYHGRDHAAEAQRDQERHEQTLENERSSGHETGNEEAADELSPLPSPRPLSRPESPIDAQSNTHPGQSLGAAAAAILAEDGDIQTRDMRSGSVSSSASLASISASSSSSSAPTIAGPSAPTPLYRQQQAASRAMLSSGRPSSDGGGSLSVRGGRFSLRAITSRLAKKAQKKNTGPNSGPGNPHSGSAHGPTHAVAGLGGLSGLAAYRHDGTDASMDKWQPSHRWTKTHDMVYAKLCYATLLFRSPRKSNYIIMRGKQWLVDWTTGNMQRVAPPRYGDVETQPGPWQIMRTENMRI